MRKRAFCICDNKDADSCAVTVQLIRAFVFATYSTISLLPKSDISRLAIFCGCIVWFVLDLVGKPEDRFCLDAAHIIFFSID